MIRIYDGGNQLNLTRELGANVSYEHYLFSAIKSVSWTKDLNNNYYLLINFITDDSDNPLKVKLLDTGSPTSAAQYANTEAGAKLAVLDLHTWINNSLTALTDLATEVTLQQVEVNTSGAARTPGLIRPNNVSGNVNTVAANFYSVSVANVGLSNGTVLGTTIKPGEILNFSADALNNYFTSFAYNATGTEFIITYIF
jgi:flagella basal body P-ring formation protein FlgA